MQTGYLRKIKTLKFSTEHTHYEGQLYQKIISYYFPKHNYTTKMYNKCNRKEGILFSVAVYYELQPLLYVIV